MTCPIVEGADTLAASTEPFGYDAPPNLDYRGYLVLRCAARRRSFGPACSFVPGEDDHDPGRLRARGRDRCLGKGDCALSAQISAGRTEHRGSEHAGRGRNNGA